MVTIICDQCGDPCEGEKLFVSLHVRGLVQFEIANNEPLMESQWRQSHFCSPECVAERAKEWAEGALKGKET